MVTAEESENHKNYVAKVHQDRCPHKSEEVHNLAADDCELELSKGRVC